MSTSKNLQKGNNDVLNDVLKAKVRKKSWKIEYEDQQRLIELFATWETKTRISRMMWVTRPTLDKYLKDNPRVVARIEMAREYPNLLANKTVIDRMIDWDWRLALDYLKLTNEKFKPKQEIQNNTTVVNILTDIRAKNKARREAKVVDAQNESPMIDKS